MSSHAHGLEPVEAACRDAGRADRIDAAIHRWTVTWCGLAVAAALGIAAGRGDWVTVTVTALLTALLTAALALLTTGVILLHIGRRR